MKNGNGKQQFSIEQWLAHFRPNMCRCWRGPMELLIGFNKHKRAIVQWGTGQFFVLGHPQSKGRELAREDVRAKRFYSKKGYPIPEHDRC